MDLPIRRRDDDRRPEQECERLRHTFAGQLEQWPDFVRSLERALHDVAPLTDIQETDDSYLLEVELPGVKREDIDLQVDQGRLRLTGERRQRERVGLLRHRTRTTGRFSLDVTLPQPSTPTL
jgi:HSP20 family protein